MAASVGLEVNAGDGEGPPGPVETAATDDGVGVAPGTLIDTAVGPQRAAISPSTHTIAALRARII